MAEKEKKLKLKISEEMAEKERNEIDNKKRLNSL